jgi:ABC-type transport system involved in multi-copper enzyme maturation permease subunit
MGQRTAIIAAIILLIVAGAILLIGTFSGHNGLFSVGADAFKLVIGACVGAIATAFGTATKT